MNLRNAVAADYLQIAELHATSWRTAYRGALSDEYLDGKVISERLALWEERLHRPRDNQIVVLLHSNDALLGFACGYAGADSQWGSLLDNIHVVETARRIGAGSMLLAETARRCAAAEPDAGLYLWVLQSNADAQRFYESRGGQRVGEGVWAAPDGREIPEFRYAWPAGRFPQAPA